MKDFIIYYEHTSYGYYSHEITETDIQTALDYFIKNHNHKAIYGIMLKF